MEKSKTYKLCSVSVEFSANHDFKFLVPTHLVDENGNIDDEITQEITEKFECHSLTLDDLDRSYGCTMYEVKVDFSVDKECGYDSVESGTKEVFGV